MKREPTPEGRALPLATARRAGLRMLAGAVLAMWTAQAVAQAPRAAGAASSASAPVREEGVRWSALTPPQREALAPLERDWPGIDAPRKQKWIALAGRFSTLSPEERARINARMVEWAKLTPAERGQARLRFEEARQLPVPDRSERWRAYQALPPEQRQQLAARAAAASAPRDAASKPAKAGRDSKEAKFNVVPNPALGQAPRPVAPTMVQAAPGATTTVITRRPAPPPHQQSGMPKIATTPEFVNRSTLLPQRGPQAAAVGSAPPAAALPAARPAPAPATPMAGSSRPAAAPAPPPLAATTSAPAPSR
jgi:Protein of unknown function (DUF3106)